MAWHAGRILLALALHFQWMRNHIFPEWYVDGGIADLVLLTKAGYLTEVEIKISLSDWNADQHKRKFNRDRPHVSRFFYAIPETLEGQIPQWIPDTAGLIVVRSVPNYYGFRDAVTELRAAKRVMSKKIAPHEILRMHESAYYRYWNARVDQLHSRYMDRPRAKAVAEGRT